MPDIIDNKMADRESFHTQKDQKKSMYVYDTFECHYSFVKDYVSIMKTFPHYFIENSKIYIYVSAMPKVSISKGYSSA